VQHILNYQIEDSCDEKLLKLLANRVNNDAKVNDVKLITSGVQSLSPKSRTNTDVSVD